MGGALGLYYMYKLYRIPARPFWNHWQTGTAFFGTMLAYGALLVLLVSTVTLPEAMLAGITALAQSLSGLIVLGILVESIGHLFHARAMNGAGHEGAASYYVQTTEYGKSYLLRNVLLLLNGFLAMALSVTGLATAGGYLLLGLLALSMLVTAAFGRSLFFVLVIPTTMPGAFFWKNQGFVEHARNIGLADAPQHGVAYERHHAFKFDELITTMKETSIKDMYKHVKWIFGK